MKLTFFLVFAWVIATIGGLIIARYLGAWMLRINEIISIQKQILEELKKNNNSF